MRVYSLEVGSLGTNCYIVSCEETLQAAVIDPGGNSAEILALINAENLAVSAIINTHGHADHIAANGTVQQATGAQIMIHRADADMLTSPQRNLSAFIGEPVVLQPADRLLEDGDVIEIGNFAFHVLHTPGHTPGGICLLEQSTLFSGDTLFAESIGRSDFPGGSYSQLVRSVQEKLLVLPDNVQVYPGHGPATNIGWERKMNPFIQ